MGGRRHGTNSCYCGGCRYPECRAAHTVYARELQRRRLDQIRRKRAARLVSALEAALAEPDLSDVEERGLRLALARHRRALTG